MRLDRLAMVLVALVLAPATKLTAQETPEAPPAYASAVLGLLQFELDGSGLAPMIAVRAGRPITSVLMIEGSVMAARPNEDSGTSTLLIPEVQLQLGLPFTNVRPYMGLGTGAAFDFRDSDAGGTQVDFTISGAIGARTWIGERWGVAVEFRARGIGADFDETTAEYTAGATWRL